MLELIIQRGGKRLIRQPIGDEPITIGRSSKNTLRLLDECISREHCRIEWKDGILKLSDLSSNGTFINGNPKQEVILQAGDKIAIGPWTLMVQPTVDAVPIKTVVDQTNATHVLQYDANEKQLVTERIEFVVHSPDQTEIRKRISSSEITIGQHASCELAIADPYISRRHCKLINRDGNLKLIDLGSTNGTFVNDIRITHSVIPRYGAFRAGRSMVLYRTTQTAEQLSPSERNQLGSLYGKSTVMREIFTLIEKIAPSDATICISGESGTGKELVARELHELSARRRGPFIAINCGAIPKDIIESQLFGHERGAFTGALERAQGLFEQASGGTLLLDEIGEMPLELQTRLLRVLEDRTIRRIGGNEEIPIDVRLICATNKNLRRMVVDGRFREDLFFRIFVVPIDLPPLRERREDIPLIATHLLEMLRVPDRNPTLTETALKKLEEEDWPGNVRELKNMLMRALALADHDIIDACDLKLVSINTINSDSDNLKSNEVSYLISNLEENDWNVTKVAKRLGIARTTLQAKMRRYGIKMPKN